MGENGDFEPLHRKISRNSQTVSNRQRLLLTMNWKFAVDFFARRLHTRTAVARLPLHQLGFLVYLLLSRACEWPISRSPLKPIFATPSVRSGGSAASRLPDLPLPCSCSAHNIHDFSVHTLFDFDVLTGIYDAFRQHISVSNQ